MLLNCLLVGLGGFAGSVCRFLLSMALAPAAHTFMVGTFTVNCLGSLLIGLFMAVLPSGGWHFLAVAGFCGGFTTFSTFSADTLAMFTSGNMGTALLYIFTSVAVCIGAVWLGMVLGTKFILK